MQEEFRDEVQRNAGEGSPEQRNSSNTGGGEAAVVPGIALAPAEGLVTGYVAAERTAGARLRRPGQHFAAHALCLEAAVRGAGAKEAKVKFEVVVDGVFRSEG